MAKQKNMSSSNMWKIGLIATVFYIYRRQLFGAVEDSVEGITDQLEAMHID